MMHYPTITALAAAAFGLVYIVLTMRVGLFRARKSIFLGDGDNTDLLKRIRVHGNFAEFVPMVIILLALIEGMGAAPHIVLGIAVMFLVVRVAHAIGLSTNEGPSVGRIIGGFGTILILLGSSLLLGVMATHNFMS